MTISANFHDPKTAESRPLGTGNRNNALGFSGGHGEYITLFTPPHVAAATAKAFNRAMQVTQGKHGLVYATPSGVWNIDNPYPDIWTAQNDEVTGDGDPGWMFADAKSLEGLQDAVDNIEAECSCTECKALVGEDNLTEISRTKYLCADCLEEAGKRAAGLAEMAGDDIAHAMRERMQEKAQ